MPADRDDDRDEDRPRRRDDDAGDDRPRRRRREEDEDDDFAGEPPVLPQGVKIAGLVWLVVGILILVVSMVSFALNMAMPQPAAAGGNAAGANATSGVCGAIFGLLVGAVFVTAGNQTRSGKAKGTMGNGIGSIIFGLIAGGVGTLATLGSFVIMQQNAALGTITLVLSVLYVLAGIALLAAGVMAVSGQEAYKKWRKWKVRQSR